MRVVAIAIVVLCLVVPAQGQTIKRFTPDSVKFLQELSILMTTARKKEGKDFIEEFQLVWYSGKVSERKRQHIYKVCNFMLKKKMRPFPDFKSYLFSLGSFINSGQPEESFEAWQESIEKLISKSRKKFSAYLAFCNNLFSENAIYKSASTTWQVSNSDYQFTFTTEPIVIFESLDLRCLAKGDSAVIYDTKGVYYPNQHKWVGEGGSVYWLRAGFPVDEVYAIVRHYEIICRSASYTADSVVFYNSNYFDKPLMGKLTEKVLANVTAEKASYPRFDSYSKRLKIRNLQKGVDFDGGFSQYGGKFIGKGDAEKDAYIIFKRDDKPFLVVSSKTFSIRQGRILANPASIVMFMEHETKDGMVTDSITHPGLKFNYRTEDRIISLLRSREGISKSPFFDSFHGIDMYFEELKWKIDSPKIEMGPLYGSTDRSAIFESAFYFRESRFDRMMGIDREHPLVLVKRCFEKEGTDVMYASELSKCGGIPVTQIRPLLMRLAQEGFVYYDFDDDRVVPKEKLYHYVLSKGEKSDYDVIQFNSEVAAGTNATLSLLNFDMDIFGVRRIFLSDSQNVTIFPKGQQIQLKQNRNFKFTGVVNAGRFQYFGKEFSFEYDNFKIKMPNVDSLRIFVSSGERDEYGKRKLKKVRSVVEHVDGELRIDGPGNKSGQEDLPEFPIFTSKRNSYVFYERDYIQRGVYSKDRFFFELAPFEFDSLDNFANEQLRFDGRFASTDIFPEFEETLTLMPDLSLGFRRPTPPKGYPVYQGKGSFKNDIVLSNQGLRGDGVLKYLNSTTESDDFLFFPDSMTAYAQSFVNEEQLSDPEYPPVWGSDVYVYWRPYLDRMKVTQVTEPLTFYDGNSKLHGSMLLQPSGITGSGMFEFENAELEADLIRFKFKEFDSDTADFRLKALQEGKMVLAFSTKDYKAHVDFQERKGVFISNGSGSFIDFHDNQYIAFMNKFTWYMDAGDIELSADVKAQTGVAQDLQLEGAKFISVHPDQDSLTFYSPAARYDLNNSIIYANEVKYIQVADAMIYPDSSRLVVEKKAKMRTLENARILANFVTQYHNIYNATVNIFARKRYIASGDYDYQDENRRKQMIHFDNVAVDTTAQTYATGTIDGDQNFTLSPAYEYIGEVRLTASNPYLTLTGTAKIGHNCVSLPRRWFYFSSEIDPQDIYIPIDSVIMDVNKDPLSAGVLMAKDSIHVYSTFLSQRRKASDPDILSINGFLFYDKKRQEYKISDMQKLNEFSLPGNYMSLNTNTCQIYGEGKLSFGTNLGQVRVQPVGNIVHDLTNDSVTMDLMVLMDFFFNNNALEKMGKAMIDDEELDPTDFDRPLYTKGLQNLLGKVEADKLITDMNLYGNFKRFPAGLNKSLFLNDVKMRWNQATHSYRSTGHIGIGNVYKKQVNKFVDGHIEIVKKRSGDKITIYLELAPKQWYFFHYERNLLQAISSDDDFNSAIKETKPDKRKYKHQKGEAPYTYMFSNETKKRRFLQQFEDMEDE